MKKLLILGTALLGLFTLGFTARAGDDGPAYSERPSPQPAPGYYEGRVVGPPCYLPPPAVFFAAPFPRVAVYGRVYHHRRYVYPYPYAYSYAPGVRIGVGF
jgi:hypothetical protein